MSVGKLDASHLLQTMRETLFRLCEPQATLWGDDAPFGGRVHEVGLSSYLISIGGGTDQIQRNIIGERVLGLPREPRADKDVPFRDLRVGTQDADRYQPPHPDHHKSPMRSEALENLVTMLRAQADERGAARRLADRVRAAGGDVTLFEAEDLIHVWHFFADPVPEADEVIARVARFIGEPVV